MTEIQDLLERQSRWQESLRDLPWPEKVRRVEAVLDSIRKLRRAARRREGSDFPAGPPAGGRRG